jgi:protein-tyrosine-phosphatase/GNAT superfamily N-acetyltransferase
MEKGTVIQPASPSQMETVRELWIEYWKSFDFTPCFQNFDRELKTLPGDYGPPDGCILLAYYEKTVAGGVALRKLGDGRCEMKRLFVRPAYRGKRVGLALTEAIIDEGRRRNFTHMRLDTIMPAMAKAIEIYRSLGFEEIEPYTLNRIPGGKYFELDLRREFAAARVLFVCVENSCRSQMAEAFARMHGRGRIEAHSAGSRASGIVHPRAVESMREIGYDLSAHRSKSFEEVPASEYDYVVTMGCGDACPSVPARNREDWEIPDPKNLPPDEFRKIRDEIENRVKKLIAGARAGRD